MRIIHVLIVFVMALAFPTLGLAQSTAFTYQGKLTSNAQPAEGLHDFRFRLYDSVEGGTQIGATLCVDNLLVSGGVFTTTIDFGAQFVTTGSRFLEIEVRSDTGLACPILTGFELLKPRQAVTSTPMATHAKSAFALAAADGSPATAVVVNNSGQVGIGVLVPTHTLQIGSTLPTLALQDLDSSGGASGQQVGYVSFRDSGDVERAWIGFGSIGDPDLAMINARPSGDIVLNTFGGGNVGIGTSSPAAKLQVNGDIKLGNAGEHFAVRSPGRDRILRGYVNANGTINTSQSSTGFTITHSATGVFVINFNEPFASPPTLVVGAAAQCCKPRHNGSSTTSAVVHVNSVESPYTNTNSPFSFIVIGP